MPSPDSGIGCEDMSGRSPVRQAAGFITFAAIMVCLLALFHSSGQDEDPVTSVVLLTAG